MRYKLRKDNLHARIVAELKQAGFAVADTYQAGHGFPDLVISMSGLNVLVEVKTLKYIPKLDKTRVRSAVESRRASQVKFAASWKGPIITAYSASEVVSEFNRLLKLKGWSK